MPDVTVVFELCCQSMLGKIGMIPDSYYPLNCFIVVLYPEGPILCTSVPVQVLAPPSETALCAPLSNTRLLATSLFIFVFPSRRQ